MLRFCIPGKLLLRQSSYVVRHLRSLTHPHPPRTCARPNACQWDMCGVNGEDEFARGVAIQLWFQLRAFFLSQEFVPAPSAFSIFDALPNRKRAMSKGGEPAGQMTRQESRQNARCLAVRPLGTELRRQFHQFGRGAIRTEIRGGREGETGSWIASLADQKARISQRNRAENCQNIPFLVVLDPQLIAAALTGATGAHTQRSSSRRTAVF